MQLGTDTSRHGRLDLGPVTWFPGEHTPVFTFGHRLADDPLLSLDALAALADRLPPDRVEVARPDEAGGAHRFPTTRCCGPGAGAVVRDVAEQRRWIALHQIEHDPAYRVLVESLFAEFLAAAGIPAGSAHTPEGYVFISASHTAVPFHVDHEHNLFLQVQGEKHFRTASFPDVLRHATTFEGMYSGDPVEVDFEPVGVTTHVLRSGDGLFVSPDAVHGVETADAVSISLSIVWTTPELQRSGRVYAVNHHLRRLGLSPLLPERAAGVDRAKSAAALVWRRAGDVVRRLRPSGRR